MVLLFSALSIVFFTVIVLGISVIVFFILMRGGVIKRNDITVGIEDFCSVIVKFIAYIFTHGAFGNKVEEYIDKTKPVYKCRHCNYPDDVKRPFCFNCSKDNDGFYIEHVLPYKCGFCFYKSSKPFVYCLKCGKNKKGIYENGGS